jgi:CDP-glucose 4,6-dehydratase
VQQMALHWAQVRWEDVSHDNKGPYESGLLKLNCDKALHYLGWEAVLGFEETVRLTAEWYRAYYEEPEGIAAITEDQINKYIELASQSRT